MINTQTPDEPQPQAAIKCRVWEREVTMIRQVSNPSDASSAQMTQGLPPNMIERRAALKQLPMQADHLMTVSELAKFSNLSPSKIYLDVAAEAIPYHRWGRGGSGRKPVIRFQKSEILAWLKAGCPINKLLGN
jgi:hypothetical protein